MLLSHLNMVQMLHSHMRTYIYVAFLPLRGTRAF